MLSETECDLLVFSVVPRAHLLLETWKTFKIHCPFRFNRTILSIAGMDKNYFPVIDTIKPDVLLWDWNIQGYYTSAKRAVLESEMPFHFWLEDDYIFERDLPIEKMIEVLKINKDIIEIAIPMGVNDFSEIKISNVTWMVATLPHLGNGELMRENFAKIDPNKICKNGESLAIEEYLGRCFKGYKAGILGSVEGRYMTHIGALYSSERSLVNVSPDINKRQHTYKEDEFSDKAKKSDCKSFRSFSWLKKFLFHIIACTRFIALLFRSICTYPFSKKTREFVLRSLQYYKHTP